MNWATGETTWECECNIGELAIAEYDERKREVQAALAERRRAAAASGTDTTITGDSALTEATAARSERALQRAQKKACDVEPAAEDENTSDFNVSTHERLEFDRLIGCKNLKEDQYKKKKRSWQIYVPKAMSAGVLALIASCGLFVSVKEMTGSESLQQVPAHVTPWLWPSRWRGRPHT